MIRNPRSFYLIKRAEIEVTSLMTEVLDPLNMTPIQFAILYFVEHDQGDLSSAQLSRRFSMTPQSMNELVGILQSKELIKKTTDKVNKRILRINLTAKGKKVLQESNQLLDKIEKKLLIELNDDETLVLKNLLGKIVETARKL